MTFRIAPATFRLVMPQQTTLLCAPALSKLPHEMSSMHSHVWRELAVCCYCLLSSRDLLPGQFGTDDFVRVVMDVHLTGIYPNIKTPRREQRAEWTHLATEHEGEQWITISHFPSPDRDVTVAPVWVMERLSLVDYRRSEEKGQCGGDLQMGSWSVACNIIFSSDSLSGQLYLSTPNAW